MPRQTPFHPRTAALVEKGGSFAWKEWAGYIAVSNFDRHSEREYFAIRHTAGLLDVTPLYKYDLTGPDAARVLARVFTRDITKIRRNQVVYSAMSDERGKCLDDGTVARIGPETFRATSSEPWLRWLLRHARGYDVQIEETTDKYGALALQGPRARDVLRDIVDFDMDIMRFFRIQKTTLAGLPVWVSRTGYTGDLGFEIWTDNDNALAVYDAILQAGRPHGIEPIGLDALDVSRIEAGFVLQGIDYICARTCLIEGRKSTPDEAGLAWTVSLEDRDEPFIGQDFVERERQEGSTWALVGMVLDWQALETLYDDYGLPPHLAPHASRDAVPIFDGTGTRQVGQATSLTWSPTVKKFLAIGQVYAEYGRVGTPLFVEHTVEFHRRKVPAVVADRPFFDPERKKFTPKKPKRRKPA